MNTPNLLVLGGPDAGKSTYRAQLLHRLEEELGTLRLARSIKDRRSIEGDADRVASGLQPMHTNHDAYHSIIFEITGEEGRVFTLEFPDYGGEQVRQIGEHNALPPEWAAKVRASDHWLFFIRIDAMRAAKSFLTDPVSHGYSAVPVVADSSQPQETASRNEPAIVGNEFRVIELLQRLLFTHGVSLRLPATIPRLCVLLSCWDLLPETEQTLRPPELLEKRGPLLANFLKANWKEDDLRIFALTSTECSLPEDEPNVEFATKGATAFGYVLDEQGRRENDLTYPVAWLME